MRRSAGAARPLHPAALLLLLAAACLPAQDNTTTVVSSSSTLKPPIPGSTNTSSPTAVTQTASHISAHDSNGTITTALGSTKTPATTTQTTTAATTTTNQTTSVTTSEPTTNTQSTASVTVTISKTTSPSTSAAATPKSEGVLAKTSRFDVGSFVGGIVLTLGLLAFLYIGCKTYHSRRGVQYRTIDEHDAII
ncbi:porimin [Carettochelys insculpta]|uniref:porimin n=1 Tax=Carettochelys insculpta TaxID=44489 RepID=UPI003EBD3A41